MGMPGRLTKKDYGYSMPVTAPLYYTFPIHYRDATILTIKYRTDPEAVARILPSQLDVPDDAFAVAIFADYRWSSLGAYKEVAQAVCCTRRDDPVPVDGKGHPLYAVQFHVTTGTAMAAGREIAGIQKKIGDIGFAMDELCVSYLDRPTGVRICSANFIPDAPMELNTMLTEYISLRVMPNPVTHDPADPTLSQLIGSSWEIGPGEFWSGTGNCHFTGASAHDPYHALPIVNNNEPPECHLFRGEITAKNITFVQDI